MQQISIHALREEGDSLTMPLSRSRSHFYPRPPRGGRRAMRGCGADPGIFLSTPSARRATDFYWPEFAHLGISIHALREEGDRSRPWCGSGRSYFYPRPPRGGRPAVSMPRCRFHHFYPRPPRGGRLSIFLASGAFSGISIHALREEGDVQLFVAGAGLKGISIHALREEGDRLVLLVDEDGRLFLSTPSARRATKRPSA